MKKKNKLVYGIGVNDSDYQTQKFVSIEGKKKLTWICPFYLKWKEMICRCYSNAYNDRRPTYKGCSVVPEWHYFMTFRAWMKKQDWEDKQLDKDILFFGNRVYSPETCVFVTQKVNSFLIESGASRGEWPVGVYFHKSKGKFRSQCWNVVSGKRTHLGYFDTPEEAHQAWLAFKLEQAYILAAEQTDQRVAKALIDRYENYGNLD